MTIRLYVKEDAMDKDLVQAIRARGVDVITALDAGMIERADILTPLRSRQGVRSGDAGLPTGEFQ